MELERNWNNPSRWLFDSDFFQRRTPSRLIGLSLAYEDQSLQHLCTFIQDLGQRLGVTQLCINTACVFLRRFFCFVDLKRFHRHVVAATCLFLAAKVEEQPRKLEHLISSKIKLVGNHVKVSYTGIPSNDQRAKDNADVAACVEDFKSMENLILKVLGFDLTIDHPHTYVVKGCQMLKASKDFAQTAYFLATNSLHLTNMCVQYPSPAVACVCIYLASKWARYQIPTSIEGKQWFSYIDKEMTLEKLQRTSSELMNTFEQCPDKLKRNMLMAKQQQEKEEPEKKRRRVEAPLTIVSGGSQPVAGPSGVSNSRAQTVAGSSSESSNRLQQPGDSSRPQQQHPSLHYRPGPSRNDVPVAKSRHPGEATRESASLNQLVKTEPNLIAVTNPVSQNPSGPVVLESCQGSNQSSTTHDQSITSSSRNESAVNTSRPESGVIPVESQERYGFQPSRSHPSLTASDSGKKSHKLSLHDYQQRHDQTHRPQGTCPIKTEHNHTPQSKEPITSPVKTIKKEPITSPVKTIKKEGVISSVPENVHLKEAKVMVQDLKDSQGQDRVMYANAEACRKRSLSQSSKEDNTEIGLVPKHRIHQHHHRGERQIEQRKVQSGKHHSGKSSASSSGGEGAEPIKLHIKRDAGTLQIKNPSHEPSPTKSSPLKVKIRRNPETSAMLSSEVSGDDQKDPGIKLRLPVPSAGPSRTLEKHSHHHSATGHSNYSNGGHERKHRHTSRSHTHLPATQHSGLPSNQEKSLHRSASSSLVAPPPPEESEVICKEPKQAFQSHKSHSQSRPHLKTQHSGFSFLDSFISPTVPDMIFEPDTPTEVNGGSMGAPPTPTPENMNRVSAQMQQLYAQTKSHQSVPNFPPPIHHQMLVNNISMYRAPQPPLPPPLPDNPPPPPPPPPQ